MSCLLAVVMLLVACSRGVEVWIARFAASSRLVARSPEIGTVVRCSPLHARREASTVAERCAPHPRWKTVTTGGSPQLLQGWPPWRGWNLVGAVTRAQAPALGACRRGGWAQQECLWHDASVPHTHSSV